MTVTYNLEATDATLLAISQIRLELGDVSAVVGQGVKPDGTAFSDAELTVFYAREGDVLSAAAAAAEALSRWWARAVTISIGGRSEALSDISKQYAALAVSLRARATDSTGAALLTLGWVEPACPTSYVEGDGTCR